MKITTETYGKFRIGELVIKEYENWLLLTRVDQATLGSLVLINKNGAADFGELSSGEMVEMGIVVSEVEKKLKTAFGYDKINYLMLRMKDPEVHFHIIPRYAEDKVFEGRVYKDENWPGPLGFQGKNQLEETELLDLHNYLKELFGEG